MPQKINSLEEILFNNNSNALFLYDLKSDKFIKCNQAALDTFSINSSGELGSLSLSNLFEATQKSGHVNEILLENIENCLNTGKSSFAMTGKTIANLPLSTQLTLYKISNDDQSSIIMFDFKNNSNIRKLEKNLIDTQKTLDYFIDNLPGAVFCKDIKGRYLFTNETFLNTFTTNIKDACGYSDIDFFPRLIAQKLEAHDKEVLDAKCPKHFIEEVSINNKIRTFETYRFPIIDTSNQIILAIAGVSVDISDKVQLEKQQEILKQKADILSIVATYNHEFRNPITIAGAMVNIIEKKSDGLEREINAIKDCHRRIIDTLKEIDLLETGKIDIEDYCPDTKIIKLNKNSPT